MQANHNQSQMVTMSHKRSQCVQTVSHMVTTNADTHDKTQNVKTDVLHKAMRGSMQVHPHGSVRNGGASFSCALAVERFLSFANNSKLACHARATACPSSAYVDARAILRK